jgi:hypothetical protein
MVFSLVDAAIFSTTENDSIEDFKGAYTFHDAFVTPFIPAPRVLPTAGSRWIRRSIRPRGN